MIGFKCPWGLEEMVFHKRKLIPCHSCAGRNPDGRIYIDFILELSPDIEEKSKILFFKSIRILAFIFSSELIKFNN
jgi:hypothetical protein